MISRRLVSPWAVCFMNVLILKQACVKWCWWTRALHHIVVQQHGPHHSVGQQPTDLSVGTTRFYLSDPLGFKFPSHFQ